MSPEGLSHERSSKPPTNASCGRRLRFSAPKPAEFLAGEIPEDEFRPFRLKHGIYGQRQPGVQMVRCKIPGGLLTAAQMEQLARIADEFAGGKGHLTTRQNMQYHFVPLARVAGPHAPAGRRGPHQSRGLLQHRAQRDHLPVGGHRAATRSSTCGPTRRSVAYAFLRKDLTGNLPRKFKIAFDGCRDNDCIAGAINDIGLRAVVRDGRRGFRMVDRRRARAAAHRSPTARRVPARGAPAEQMRGRSPRVQQVRQPRRTATRRA